MAHSTPAPAYWRWFIGIALLFLLINFSTAGRYPLPWVDEVQFSDPAVNLATGHGFTSTAWFAQDSSAFFAGNVPLYSLVLAGWLKLFGVSALAVRSLNFVLITALCALLWHFVASRGLVASPVWRSILILLVMTSTGISFSYRMGRYDVLGMILFVLAAYAWTSERRASSFLLLALCGAAFPWAGLQLLPGAVVICGFLTLFLGWPALTRSLALGGGIAAGGVTLFLFYRAQGVWEAFRYSTTGIGNMGDTWSRKLARIPHEFPSDKSGLLLLATAMLLLFATGVRVGTWRKNALLFAAALGVTLPLILIVAGKYPLYYGWMTFIPAALILTSTLSRPDGAPAWARMGAIGLLALAMVIGLPARLLSVLLHWSDRDPARLEALVDSRLSPTDVVIADFRAYYALKQTHRTVYLPTYIDIMPASERSAVTALLVAPSDADRVRQTLGDDWTPTGVAVEPWARTANPALRFLESFSEPDPRLELFRKSSSASR